MNKILKNSLFLSSDYPLKTIVGRNTYGTPEILCYESAKTSVIEVGAFCSIAKEVKFLVGGNHFYDRWTTYPMNLLFDDQDLPWHEYSKSGIKIGNDVWIGYGVTILDGTVIGDGAVIGAKAVVSGKIPPCSIVAGNPARVIKQRFDCADKYLELKWWERSDEEIKAMLIGQACY